MTTTVAARRFAEVSLSLIDDPALASRSDMDDDKMAALVESIRAEGILENLILVDRAPRYEVVAGHRRTIAARLANLTSVPAWVYPADHPSLRLIQAHENARREDLNPVDEALWFAELLERDCGGDVERLAGVVGEKLSHVLNRLELLELDDATRDALKAGKIPVGVARELRKVTDLSHRAWYLDSAIRGGATVSLVTGWVMEWKNTFGVQTIVAPPTVPVMLDTSAPAFDPHRCEVCQTSDPRFFPEQKPIHTHCWHAIVEPLLKQARGGE